MKRFSNQTIWRILILVCFVIAHGVVVFGQEWVMDEIAEESVGGPFSGILGAVLTLGLIWLLGTIFGGEKDDRSMKQSGNYKAETTKPSSNQIKTAREEKAEGASEKTIQEKNQIVIDNEKKQAIDFGSSVKWASFNLGVLDYKYYQEQCKIREDEKDRQDFFCGSIYVEDKIKRDEHGVVYSSDGKRLLDGSHCDCSPYEILEGTEFVCDGAFRKRFTESITKGGRKGFRMNIILPSSLIYISESALPEMCQIESKCPNYCIINELLIDTRSKCVIKSLNKFIQKIVLNEPIEEIGDMAFMNCEVLQEVFLPNTLKKIGKRSFYNNKLLKKINLPNSIEIIEEDAFFYCESLYISKMPQSLKSIGSSAFSWCNLQDSVIPESILYIGKAPFPKNCNNLKSESRRFIVSDGLLIDKTNLSVIQFINSAAKSVTIPQNVTRICPNAFHHCDIEAIFIPSNIIEIGSGSFWGCSNLKKIEFEGSLSCIPTISFSFCNSLTSIKIPSGVEVIEIAAFDNCKLLQNVQLNNDLKKISNCAFIECPSLTSLSIPESVEVIGNRKQYDQLFFRNCRNLHNLYYDAKKADISGLPSSITKLTIGEHVEALPAFLLSYNSNIESFTIPTNVRKISRACIFKCSKLREIIIMSKSITLEEDWIRDCDNLAVIHIPRDSYDNMLPLLPQKEGLKIKKIYDHHFLFFKW